MHKTAVAVVLSLVLLPASAQAGKAGKVDKDIASTVEWGHSYSAAVKQAQADDKPLLLKFYSTWCPHCVRMDRTTWQDETIGELSKEFVSAKVNADVDKVPVKRYRLTGYPTLIVAEPHGEEVFRLEGYTDPEKVATYLKVYGKHSADIQAAFTGLRKDRSDPTALLALGRFYKNVGLKKSAASRFEKAMKRAEGADWLEACTGAGICLVAKKEYKAGLKLLEQSLAKSGKEPGAEVLLYLGLGHAGIGATADAKGELERVISQFPDSKEAKKARKALDKLAS